MSEPVQITAELRAIVPQPGKLVEAKILDHLDEQASAFLAVSPFLLL
jgi:predicted pyridoxine 5'-phosphate oxidase superfamily flavin-nucleotide-binding protein